MRHVVLAALLAAAASATAEDIPQAVSALRHLNPRPSSGPTAWTAGPYQYDGAGNITGIGSESYVYDTVGRLKSATVRGPDLTTLQTQAFGYDAYGNLTSTAKLGQTVPLPTTAATNHLDLLGYDAAGNVITAGAQHYSYDAVGMLNTVRLGTATQPRIIYAYTADDERLFAFDVAANTTHWTLRGLDNKVLRSRPGPRCLSWASRPPFASLLSSISLKTTWPEKQDHQVSAGTAPRQALSQKQRPRQPNSA